MNYSLSGRNALVCGASKGIGRATAIALAKSGARVWLLARSESLLKDLCTSLGPNHNYIVADSSELPSIQRALDRVLGQAETIHIVVNNTGGPPAGNLLEATAEALNQAWQMHLITNHTIAQALVPGMKAANYGRIINILSTTVRNPIPKLGISSTVRAAVANWSKTLAGELGPHGICVNNILPGSTDTERLQELLAAFAEQSATNIAEVVKNWQQAIPLHRFADPSEIAQAIAYLASPAGAYINGINLPVDGGLLPCL